MTHAAAIEIVDATWYGSSSRCERCSYHMAGREYDGAQGTADYAHACALIEHDGDPFDCPAVEAELDKETV